MSQTTKAAKTPARERAALPPFEPQEPMERLIRMRAEEPELFRVLSPSEHLTLQHYERWRDSSS